MVFSLFHFVPAEKMTREISPERKTAYYVGMGLSGVGLLLFCLPFMAIPLAMFSSPFSAGRGSTVPVTFFLAFIGFILVAVGRVLMHIGRSGLAGAGLILDPRRAREEVEPFSRMDGGILKDRLDEAGLLDADGLKFGRNTTSTLEKVIMIRCQQCGQLNEDGSKFCQECGTKI